MSRLGKKPITVPKGVEVKVTGNTVHVKGPKGQITQEFGHGVVVTVDNEQLLVGLEEKAKENGNFQGLYRSLIQNMVNGVTQEFQKQLELIGVGYRAAVSGKNLDLQLGFSHPVSMPIPEGLTVNVEKNTSITISGVNKQVVGQFAADIRAKRKPEPYKGKGVRYKDEVVRKKAGKAGKAGK